MKILGFDPGRDKCGVAVMGDKGEILYHEVLTSQGALATIQKLLQKYTIETLVMGDQTTAKQWKQQLENAFAIPIVMVNERNSSLEARDRYWEMYPPRGLQRLIPQGMRLPPRPIDDIVAILLIERHVSRSSKHDS